MTTKYKTKLFIYFFIVFILFSAIIIIYQQIREKEYKQKLVETQLDIYAQMLSDTLPLISIIPDKLRITKINKGGKVIYDNGITNTQTLQNHNFRPEIIEASKYGYGSDIRQSQSLKEPFLYYARRTDKGFIRVALPYNSDIETLLKPDKTFLIISLLLFTIAMLLLWWIVKSFGLSVEKLRTDIIQQQKVQSDMKAEMTLSIAHELRTPVAAIRGYTETLQDDSIPEDKRTYFIERTHAAAIRLSELLKDISLLSKIEESAHLFHNEKVNIKDLMNQIVEEFSQPISTNAITIENNLKSEMEVYGNKTLLYSIFRNLLENAVKYAGKWVTIRICCDKEDKEFYYFSLTDTGIGVDEKLLSRIFERFYRVNDGRSRQDGGSGLGLAIVRHAVLHHGGKISAKNHPKGGLVVEFSLRKN